MKIEDFHNIDPVDELKSRIEKIDRISAKAVKMALQGIAKKHNLSINDLHKIVKHKFNNNPKSYLDK